jgi:hypothetical protein
MTQISYKKEGERAPFTCLDDFQDKLLSKQKNNREEKGIP